MGKKITVGGVEEKYGFKKSAIYKMVHERRIPHIKIGGYLRFDEDILEDWFSEHEVKPRQTIVNL